VKLKVLITLNLEIITAAPLIINPNYKIEDYFDRLLPPGVCVKDRRVSHSDMINKTSEKFIFLNINSRELPEFEFKVKIKRILDFMAFGVCDKQMVVRNHFRLNSMLSSRFEHFCYLVSSDGTIFAKSSEKSRKIERSPNVKAGDEIIIKYSKQLKLMTFIKENYLGEKNEISRLIIEIDDIQYAEITPLLILKNFEDEIEIQFPPF
jgi:hypothetical protein